mgnify:FL=1
MVNYAVLGQLALALNRIFEAVVKGALSPEEVFGALQSLLAKAAAAVPIPALDSTAPEAAIVVGADQTLTVKVESNGMQASGEACLSGDPALVWRADTAMAPLPAGVEILA